MKSKIVCSFLCFLLCLSLNIPVLAKEENVEEDEIKETEIKYPVEKVFKNDELVYQLFPKQLEEETKQFILNELNDTLKQQILSISHYGYDENIRNSEEWYKATQFYIWESIGLHFNTDDFKEYTIYRDEIQSRMNAAKPNFNQNKVSFMKEEMLHLIDSNKKLQEFMIVNQEGVSVSVEEDILHISIDANVQKEGAIELKKEEVFKGLDIYVEDTRIDTNNFTQSVCIPYCKQPYGQVNVSLLKDTVVNATKDSTSYGDLYTLQNEFIKFNEEVIIYAYEDIYDVWGNVVYIKDQIVDTFNTKEVRKLICGKYYVKNNMEIIPFVVEETTKDKIHSIEIYQNKMNNSYVFKQELEENKKIDSTSIYSSIYYGIYTKEDLYGIDGNVLVSKDSLIYLSNLDENGYLNQKINLPKGNYYLKQLTTHELYELNDKIYEFSVNEDNEMIYLGDQGILTNTLCRSDLTVFNTGKRSKKTLMSTFTLYDENMEEVQSFTTNRSGNYVVKDLVHGTYYLKEKNIQEGYKFKGNSEKIELNENEIIHVENEKIPTIKNMVNTSDTSNARFWEGVMVASMSVIYLSLFKRLKL